MSWQRLQVARLFWRGRVGRFHARSATHTSSQLPLKVGPRVIRQVNVDLCNRSVASAIAPCDAARRAFNSARNLRCTRRSFGTDHGNKPGNEHCVVLFIVN